MDKRKLLPLFILLAAGAAAGWYWQHSRQERSDIPILKVYGNIDTRLVNLAFEVSGRIDVLGVDEGTRVKAGELLARLDARRLELARDAALAKVNAQQEVVRELLSGTRPEEIHKLEAELAAARTQAANLERSYQRIHDLEKRNLASSQQSEDAATAAQAARDNVHSMEASLALAQAGPREEQIAAAKATQAAMEAELALAQENLKDAGLYAPASGIIQSRILERGDIASPERPVFTLALTDPLWARVYLPETILGKVKPGMPARLTSDSFPDRVYDGWVGHISPSAEFTPKSVQTEDTRTDLVYQARVFACNPQGELRLGMPVTVQLDLEAAIPDEPGCPGGKQP
ncbi:MAG: efflux RND transporter periplasmic adaptor subunit [Candidatus Thiodiazotropha sp.]|jgi:HlyD family secretion protein